MMWTQEYQPPHVGKATALLSKIMDDLWEGDLDLDQIVHFSKYPLAQFHLS